MLGGIVIAREQEEGIWSSTKVVSLLGSNFIDVYVHVYENLQSCPWGHFQACLFYLNRKKHKYIYINSFLIIKSHIHKLL